MEKINTEHGIFTNNKTTGQSAVEVYNEWLANRDKPTPPSELDVLKGELEKALKEIEDLKKIIEGEPK